MDDIWSLLADEVHLWCAAISHSSGDPSTLTLSSDECARAARYRLGAPRQRYVTVRRTLRWLLGGYLGIDPSAVSFDYGPFGKPAVAAAHRSDIGFSVSHSDSLAVFAFARGTPVGVDIEKVDCNLDADAVVDRFFSAAERAVYGSLPTPQRPRAFFSAWTRKEAYLKARGTGFQASSADVEVTIAPGEPARLLGAPDDVGRWALEDLLMRPDYVGAIATHGTRRQSHHRWVRQP